MLPNNRETGEFTVPLIPQKPETKPSDGTPTSVGPKPSRRNAARDPRLRQSSTPISLASFRERVRLSDRPHYVMTLNAPDGAGGVTRLFTFVPVMPENRDEEVRQYKMLEINWRYGISPLEPHDLSISGTKAFADPQGALRALIQEGFDATRRSGYIKDMEQHPYVFVPLHEVLGPTT